MPDALPHTGTTAAFKVETRSLRTRSDRDAANELNLAGVQLTRRNPLLREWRSWSSRAPTYTAEARQVHLLLQSAAVHTSARFSAY
jgi:hypothetical protein